MIENTIKEKYYLDDEIISSKYCSNRFNKLKNIKNINQDGILIKNIEQANWFKTMNYYPTTIEHMKLLISIVDKIGIFNKFDLRMTVNMDANRLDILYAILRIMNKMFNGYLDYVVKKIFRDGLKELFICSHLTNYDLFFDQLTQDIDHFICSIIKTYYPNMNDKILKLKFINYLRSTFDKTFYDDIIKKLEYNINDKFYEKHNELFLSIIQEFITYTNETLTETYETMKIFLDKIFSPYCSQETINEIMIALKQHIDLKNLFIESCMEIDIYCEQKIDDESDNSDCDLESDDNQLSDILISSHNNNNNNNNKIFNIC